MCVCIYGPVLMSLVCSVAIRVPRASESTLTTLSQWPGIPQFVVCVPDGYVLSHRYLARRIKEREGFELLLEASLLQNSQPGV